MRDVQGPQIDTQTRGPQIDTQTRGPQIDKQTTGAQVDVQTEGPKLNCYAKHGGNRHTWGANTQITKGPKCEPQTTMGVSVSRKGRGLSKSGSPVCAGPAAYAASATWLNPASLSAYFSSKKEQ